MIKGYNPSGYFQTTTGDGHKIEGETRQCAHCGFTWDYRPGSGERRAICMNCMGLTCCRAECAAEQAQLKASFPNRALNCLPITEWNARKLDEYDRDPRWQVLPSGIVVQHDH